MTKAQYDAIVDKDENTIYLIDDDSSIQSVPNYTQADVNKVLTVNDNGTALEWTSVSSQDNNGTLSVEQAEQLNTAYNHSKETHVKFDDIPTKTSQLINDSGFSTTGEDSNLIANSDLTFRNSHFRALNNTYTSALRLGGTTQGDYKRIIKNSKILNSTIINTDNKDIRYQNCYIEVNYPRSLSIACINCEIAMNIGDYLSQSYFKGCHFYALAQSVLLVPQGEENYLEDCIVEVGLNMGYKGHVHFKNCTLSPIYLNNPDYDGYCTFENCTFE